jgi:hypothetical protein
VFVAFTMNASALATQLRRASADVAVIIGRADIAVTLADGRQEFCIHLADVLVRRGIGGKLPSGRHRVGGPAPETSGKTSPPKKQPLHLTGATSKVSIAFDLS